MTFATFFRQNSEKVYDINVEQFYPLLFMKSIPSKNDWKSSFLVVKLCFSLARSAAASKRTTADCAAPAGVVEAELVSSAQRAN